MVVLETSEDPWVPQRLVQNPSTVTSAAVKTTLMALGCCGPFEARASICLVVRDLPREQVSSMTCFPVEAESELGLLGLARG